MTDAVRTSEEASDVVTFVGDWTGPVVAAAVHAGHGLRPEIAEAIVLDDAERFREEDPFTDRLAATVPDHVITRRSRFEADLNRPRRDAVYRTPDDCWGLDVWRDSELPDALFDGSLTTYDAFYDALAPRLDALAEHRVLDGAEVDGGQLGADDVGVGLELAVGEVGLGSAPREEVVAQVVGVDRGDVEQEAEALREQRQPVVDGEVGGAQLGSVGIAHRSSPSSSYNPGRAAARPSCAHRNRSACSSPVHSSMKVFLNSSASTQPTRG